MSLQLRNWKQEIDEMAPDPKVSIRYLKLSEINGHGLFVSIIPAGEANTAHYHPKESEKYHIVKGQGTMLSLPADQLESGSPPARQAVREGMSADIPPHIVHRLVNDGKEPLTFFFEAPMSHMDKENPVRTVVKDFGGSFPAL